MCLVMSIFLWPLRCCPTTAYKTRCSYGCNKKLSRENLLRHSRGEGLHHIKALYTPRRDSIPPARPNPRPRSPEDVDGPPRKRQRVSDAPSLQEIHRTSGATNIAGSSTSTEVADPMIDTTANFDDESQFHDDGLSVLGVKDEQEQEGYRSIINFNTDGIVANINRDYNVNFNLMPGCAPPEAMNQIAQHIRQHLARLRGVDQITKIYVAVGPFYDSAIRSIDRVHVMISMVQTMMANPMLCPSKDLPETLASLERLPALMELALRAYRDTNLVHCLSSAFYIGAEEYRQLLDDLISNLANSHHEISNAVLYYIRRHVWASSFAACLLALQCAAWPELKRGQRRETLHELAKFYLEPEQESTSLRDIKVDAVIAPERREDGSLVPDLEPPRDCLSSGSMPEALERTACRALSALSTPNNLLRGETVLSAGPFAVLIFGLLHRFPGDGLIRQGNYQAHANQLLSWTRN
ncbi:hypothetical protein FIBSPDRAFT_885954 [Athelia psychrophila]|uniref:C2H2-type domain-containing protein n=1 Tax=Athelia psychrophila TaxID=1759441 RepID=A0A166RA87_9AGAM|nr:hypothetical protein FIBSPDRAFT_885954 [Fibularhizoctonia sp. CBS 109695]